MSFCAEGGIPVTGSSLLLRRAIDHDGVIRFSDEEAVEIMRRGTSRTVTGGGILCEGSLEVCLISPFEGPSVEAVQGGIGGMQMAFNNGLEIVPHWPVCSTDSHRLEEVRLAWIENDVRPALSMRI